MKYGIYFAYWEQEWNVDQKKYISKVKDLGFDVLEISCAMLKNISREELMAKCHRYIAIRTDDINRTAAVIEEKLGTKQYKVVYGEEIHLYDLLDKIETVSKTITDSGLFFTKLDSKSESLEEYYLSKVGADNE